MKHFIPFAAVLFAPAAFASAPAGAYLSVPAANPEACARACAEDGLCISWTFAEQSCALGAIVMAPAEGVSFGLSERAPAEGVSFGLSERAPAQFRFQNVPAEQSPARLGPVEAAAVKPDPTPDAPMPDLLGGPVDLAPVQTEAAGKG